MNEEPSRKQSSLVRKLAGDVIKARFGTFGEHDPSPERIEADALRFLAEKHGVEFEIDSIEREGFAHDVGVLVAHPVADPGSPVRLEWNPRTGEITEPKAE